MTPSAVYCYMPFIIRCSVGGKAYLYPHFHLKMMLNMVFNNILDFSTADFHN